MLVLFPAATRRARALLLAYSRARCRLCRGTVRVLGPAGVGLPRIWAHYDPWIVRISDGRRA